MVDILEWPLKLLIGGIGLAVLYGLGRFINYLGLLSRRNKAWIIAAFPILTVTIVFFSSLYFIEKDPFVLSLNVDGKEGVQNMSLEKNDAGLNFEMDRVRGRRIYFKDKSGRLYSSTLPANLQEGKFRANVVPARNIIYGWTYVIVKVDSQRYLHFTLLSGFGAACTAFAILWVYFSGMAGKKAYLTVRK